MRQTEQKREFKTVRKHSHEKIRRKRKITGHHLQKGYLLMVKENNINNGSEGDCIGFP